MLNLYFLYCISDILQGKSNNNPRPRADICQSTCEGRLEKVAMESTAVSSTISSASSMNTLFLSHGMTDQQQQSTAQQKVVARPRRLHPLIKILTGYGDGDESPYWNNPDTSYRPIIARIDRPQFVPAQSSSREDRTVHLAAAAAATYISRTIRIFGHHRMDNVNEEWHAGLRWIAGWDYNQYREPSSSNMSDDNKGNHFDIHHGYNTLVSDLAKMLDQCITQCIEDVNFFDTEPDSEGALSKLSKHGFLIGELITESVRILSFYRRSFGSLLSSETQFILTRTFQLAASSVAVYYLHLAWILASPVLSKWYSSLGCTETPEWLVEHEKELQQTKSARSRQRQKKKPKRRQLTKQASNKGKQTPHTDEMTTSDKKGLDQITNLDKHPQSPPADPDESIVQREENSESEHPNPIPTSKESVADTSQSSDGIPSLIMCPSTSAASFSSPTIVPMASHLEVEKELLEGSYPAKVPSSSQPQSSPPNQNELHVPTQKQRDDAAERLREFQATQIQRLLLQKKLAQSASSSTSMSGVSNIVSSSQSNKKVLRPPPGLLHQSQLSDLQNQNADMGGSDILTNNEFFLTKLLEDDDDDDDDDVGGGSTKKESTLRVDVPTVSLPPELDSSLNPAAAPFVAGGNQKKDTAPTYSEAVVSSEVKEKKAEKNKEDSWQSPGELPLMKESSPSLIKGVYGGSVW